MEYRVLGPLEVLAAGGEKRAIGGPMQQSVLAALLLRAGKTVPLQRLIDDLWDEPPETATRTIRTYVSRLRRALPEGAIESRAGGYRLVLDGNDFDLETFERQAGEGHRALAAGQCEEAARLLRSALGLWRGPALVGLSASALRREAQRLEELRLSALEDRAEADLGCGRHGELVAELRAVVDEHPFRERSRAQLMRALYYSGRPGDALEVYRDGRRMLVDELGMEPGQELRELEQAILRQDAELERREPKRSRVGGEHVSRLETEPTREQAPPHEVRKTVTVLFCDIVDSTGQGESTDPEVVRSRLARFFEEMKTIVERHEGTVEKFIGDAVMAVFGVPRAHEDDALRACRAALEMREALPPLGVEGRIGLTTGEVVTGTEERLATGDAVNVAARLEQAAAPGEVLIGKPTLELAREAVDVQALEPLELKGKESPVEAFRLRGVHEAVALPAETRFVGREKELEAIWGAWKRTLAERRCELVTVVGEAGVGKSRLVEEALRTIDGGVTRGRCLPYGEGITYWPVVEVIKQLDVLPSDPAVAAAIRSLLGESERATSPEQIAWAFRKMLEEQAPLSVVFDDIQWGEETFLDLLEHVALLSADCPLLLIAMARPELAERRPTWPIALRLEPLPTKAVEELIGSHVPSDVRDRIARAAGGNPLFVSEVLAMASLEAGEVTVPPTLRGLLDARLDQLDPGDRRVLERAAVEGEVFHRGAVQELSPEETQVTPRLASLVRQGLIRPAKSEFAGEDGFRFQHLLFRDAAYRGLAKSSRAALHERVATWLRGRDLVELDEILGYHLEQAWRYHEELGLADSTALAESARRYLGAAGRRAYSRQDYRAAVNLLQRATALVPQSEVDVALELNLVFALVWQGDAHEAVRRSASVAERAAAVGDRVGELCGRIAVDMYRGLVEPGDVGQLVALAEEALPIFEAAGDDFAIHLAYRALGNVADEQARFDALVIAMERAAMYAERAGITDTAFTMWREYGRYWGTTPISEFLARQDEQSEQERRNPWFRGHRASALAMLGRFEEARTLLAELRAELADLRSGLLLALTYSREGIEVELLAGDPAAAVALGKEGCRLLEELEQPSMLSTSAGWVAQAYYALDRLEDACSWADRGAELGAGGDDALTEMLWRQVKAKVLARRGEHSDAERLARQAIEISGETEALNCQGSAFADLAEVLALAGHPEVAAEALEQALVRYERKENLVMAERVRGHLRELRSAEMAGRSPLR